MRTTFLVKKNVNLSGREDNWIVMNADEFEAFIQSPEGKERAKYLFQLDRCSEDDAAIYAEVDADTFAVWKAEKNHQDYVYRVNKEKGYRLFSYDGIEMEEMDINGEDLIKDENCNVEEEVLSKFEVADLYAAIEKLSPLDQEMIRVFYLSEEVMTLRRYEAITGIPNQTISDRRKQALSRLKKLLEN